MKKDKFFLMLLTLIMSLSTTTPLLSHSIKSIESSLIQTQMKETDFSTAYPHLTTTIKNRLAPYLITKNHPLKAEMDKLFGTSRITSTQKDFVNAGFKILDMRPRSFVVVARHPNLKDHLVKCYFDTEHREKHDRPSWYWLANRCEGALKVKNIIQQYNIKHFDVADKWIYLQPLLDTKKPYHEKYLRHPAVLLVTDMKLVPEKENLRAWKTLVTKEMLRELYVIITLAKGSSYRADNIAYSYSGKFCFIDCEYPSRAPDYSRISSYLDSKMKAYWYSLVKAGEVAGLLDE